MTENQIIEGNKVFEQIEDTKDKIKNLETALERELCFVPLIPSANLVFKNSGIIGISIDIKEYIDVDSILKLELQKEKDKLESLKKRFEEL